MPSRLEAALLSILINGERYGREIRDAYDQRTKRELPLGSLYTTLQRLEEAGLVKSRFGDTVPNRGDRRRKYFRITGLGERGLQRYEARTYTALGGRLHVAP